MCGWVVDSWLFNVGIIHMCTCGSSATPHVPCLSAPVIVLFTSNFVFQQTQITASNIEQVADTISMIVQTNSTEDQSSENLQAVTDVLSHTVNLLGNISVSAEVTMLRTYIKLCLVLEKILCPVLTIL